MATISLGQHIRQLAEQDPDRPSITYEGRTVTRLELERRTNRLARAYEKLGVKQDDFVTIALPNGIEFLEAVIAIWKLGATPQPVSSKLPRAELDAILELAQPSLVVGMSAGTLDGPESIPPDYDPDPALSDDPLPDRRAKHGKAMTSGGSTGRPKLIVSERPAEYDPEAAPLYLELMRVEQNGAHLVPGPLYHNGPYSCALMGLFSGNHLVIMPRFDAQTALELIDQYNVDYVMMVPTMMHRIWRLGEEERNRHDLSSLRIVYHLAAPCPAWLKEAWIDWLGPERIQELYGGTESQGATFITGEEWLEHRGSVGKPMVGSQMKILDPDGNELPPGEIGEVYMLPDGGPGSTYHYIGAEPKSRDGWESLGDMGWMDEDGYLYLSDRQTDMILSGGANIYPAEVEAALDAHPNVSSSAVIGLPDEDLGQRVHAIVQTTGSVSDEELLDHLADHLVRYKQPRSFEYVNEPLRNDAGKVRRTALRDARIQK